MSDASHRAPSFAPTELTALVDRWVVIADVSPRHRELLPVGGPVVAWLFRAPDGALSAAVRCAVLDLGDEAPVAIGEPLVDAPASPLFDPELVLVDDELASAPPLPDAHRVALGLPERHPTISSQPLKTARVDDPDLHLTLARRLDQIGEWVKAESAYREAVSRSGGEPYYLVHLAAFLAEHGQVVEAIATFRRARDIVLLGFDPFDLQAPARKLLGAIEVGLAETLLDFGGPKADLHRREAEVLLGNWRDDPALAEEVLRLVTRHRIGHDHDA